MDGRADRPRAAEPSWGRLAARAVAAWRADHAQSMGAALAYYTVFSLAPLLLIVVAVCGLVFGDDAARGAVFADLRGLMGDDAAHAVEALLASVRRPEHGIAATAIGVGLLVVGATGVFGELQDALDRIWRAPAAARSAGPWRLLRGRLVSLAMILGLACLLMVSLVLGAVIAALGKRWGSGFAGWEALAQAINLAVGFAITVGVFAMVYKLMPRVRVRWSDVWLGAVVTAALFTIGKLLIGLYIGKSGIASAFGAAGSLIVVFVWVYYSAQIFLLGAEFTWIHASERGSRRGLEGRVDVDAAPDVPTRSGAATAPRA